MHELVIRDARVVDGTGAPAFLADVAIDRGRIVGVGRGLGPATKTIDAGGLTLTPGFIDVHTHYDAQVFWDPHCTPSSLHGVTTVIAGNCGLTLAPLDSADADFMLGVLSRVESIPLGALTAGVDPTWRTFADLVEVIERRGLGVNVGLLAGHTAIRRAVMGEAASERAATDDEIASMERGVQAALQSGALGFSTSTAKAHADLAGRPTPPHFADRAEFLALAGVCARHPGTSLEFIPGTAQDGISDDDVELLRGMARAAGTQINWNLLQFSRTDPDLHERQLRAGDPTASAGHGARVVALMLPNNPRMRMDFGRNNVGLRLVPGCGWLFELSNNDLVTALADPQVRLQVREALSAPSERVAAVRTTMPDWTLTETAAAGASSVGLAVHEIGVRRGTDALDTVLDLAIESGGQLAFERRLYLADDEIDALRVSLLADSRVVAGGSDAGAHVDAMSNGEYPTAALQELVRERGLLSIEAVVHHLTDVPAQLLGLHDRGRIAPGAWADLVLLDPLEVGPSALERRADLPGGEKRLFSGARGIDRVFVAGREVVKRGVLMDELPGRVLRSGLDTQ